MGQEVILASDPLQANSCLDSWFASIVADPLVSYPEGADFYSPSESFPEYTLGHLSSRPNPVYRAVRTCLANAGLDSANFDTPYWNPLGRFIQPCNRVFVLCNFVKHDDQAHGPLRFSAKCSHGSVIRALLDYVILALRGEGAVSFGNAPIQSCDWKRVLQETGADRVESFYKEHGPQSLPVRATDLRQHIVKDGILGGLEVSWHAEDNACLEVDLGEESLLDTFYSAGAKPNLRVLDYDPRRTSRCHERGKHIYVLNRTILESDVIISIPKLKTHEKVGITAGLKGCVGTVAHKDCLAHHRLGSPRNAGDEYPDQLAFLAPLSALHDFVNTRAPGVQKRFAHWIDVSSRKVLRRFTRALGGSWSGNDTCWRMALDLARIVAFADKHGCIQASPQRKHLTLTDGIVAGEGNGPLSPKPVQLGYLAFSNNVVVGDYLNCVAMGFDPSQIPLVAQAMRADKRPLVTGSPSDWTVQVNGRRVRFDEMRKAFPHRFEPPREWRSLLAGSQR